MVFTFIIQLYNFFSKNFKEIIANDYFYDYDFHTQILQICKHFFNVLYNYFES